MIEWNKSQEEFKSKPSSEFIMGHVNSIIYLIPNPLVGYADVILEAFFGHVYSVFGLSVSVGVVTCLRSSLVHKPSKQQQFTRMEQAQLHVNRNIRVLKKTKKSSEMCRTGV